MTANPTTLDDIAASILTLATTMNERFGQVDKRFDSLEGEFGSLKTRVGDLESGQRETNRRLENIEGNTEALLNDVKELYALTGS